MPRLFVGNRAYRFLQEILGLPGSRPLSHIDTDQAFATHDLSPVVEATLVRKYLFGKTVSLSAGGNSVLLDPFTDQGVGWDEITVDGDPTIDSGIPLDWDCIVAHMGVSRLTGDTTAVQFVSRYTWDGTNLSNQLITNYLDSWDEAMAQSSTAPYYARQMPIFRRADDDEQLYAVIRATAGGAGNEARVMLTCYAAPRGILRRPGYGT